MDMVSLPIPRIGPSVPLDEQVDLRELVCGFVSGTATDPQPIIAECECWSCRIR
jgi:hypothetical protein